MEAELCLEFAVRKPKYNDYGTVTLSLVERHADGKVRNLGWNDTRRTIAFGAQWNANDNPRMMYGADMHATIPGFANVETLETTAATMRRIQKKYAKFAADWGPSQTSQDALLRYAKATGATCVFVDSNGSSDYDNANWTEYQIIDIPMLCNRAMA